MTLATQQSTESFEEPPASPVHQLLDVLTTSEGRASARWSREWRRDPGESVRWSHQAQTGKRQQHLCTYLEVLHKMGSSLEGGKLFGTPGTARLRAPALPSPAPSTRKGEPVPRELELLKLRLKEQGHGGYSDSSLSSQTSPPMTAGAEDHNSQTKCQGKQSPSGEFVPSLGFTF